MPVTDEIAAKLLVRCGRHCCICRRFSPIQLQVHHIEEQGKGGDDAEDNLIALCLTCHSDVHTQKPFTRRFTVTELKLHRDQVIDMVSRGLLVAPTLPHARELIARIKETPSEVLAGGTLVELSQRECQILLAAAASGGTIQITEYRGGCIIEAGDMKLLDSDDSRLKAELRHAISRLESSGLIEISSRQENFFEGYILTHAGYLAADQIPAGSKSATGVA